MFLVYGYEVLPLLLNLEAVGLLSERCGNDGGGFG